MEGRTCHLRRRECPGAAGIGSTTCKTKEELRHNYYDREASSGFAGCGALLFMVGLRWPVESDWTRGQSRVNEREDVPFDSLACMEDVRLAEMWSQGVFINRRHGLAVVVVVLQS